MADNESDPPSWGFNEEPPPIPPAVPAAPAAPGFEPPAPQYAPPPVSQPAPPPAPQYAPPPVSQPAPPPAPGYAPPVATPSFEPPAPGYPAPGQPYSAPVPAAPAYAAPGQPPPPPPGWHAGAQPKKNRKSLWITLASIFGVLVLGIGACTVWFVSTVKAPVDESNRFLAAIDQGEYPQALAMMTSTCDGSPANAAIFDEFFAGRPIDYNLNSSSITNNNATVSGSFSSSSPGVAGNASRIEVFLRDRDGWKVCGFRLN